MMVRVVLAAALVALAGWSFQPVFADGHVFLLLAIAIPAAVAAVWGCAAVAFGPRVSGVAGTVAGFGAVLGAVAAVTRPGADVLTGFSRLVTGVLPADPDAPQVAAVSVLIGLAALVAARCALRPGTPLLPLLPAVVCLVVGLGFGAAVAPLPRWYVPAFVLCAVATILAGVPRRAVSAIAVAVIGTIVAGGAGFAATGWSTGPAASLQDLADVQVRPRQHVNPMDQYLALRDGKVPLTITGTGSHEVDRVTMVTLTEFARDGWSAAPDYRRAGTKLPAPVVPGAVASLDLRVETPDTVGWLPRPGRPATISVPGMGFDAATGDLAVPAGTATPSTYRVTGVEPSIDAGQLRGDTPAPADGPLAVPLPSEVLEFADRAIAGQRSEVDKFAALQGVFVDSLFRYDASKKPKLAGDGLYQVKELLKSYRGTSEQYASAFALLCRHLGWDARVVLGFEPKWTGGRFHIDGSTVFAWVEVRFLRLGWVPVDPSPTHLVSADDPASQQEQERPKGSFVPVPAPVQQVPPEPGSHAVDATPPPSSPAGMLLLLPVVALLVMLAPFPLRALRRRHDRTKGSPRRRVARAWRHTVDVLRLTGCAVDHTSTTGQVVACVAAAQPLADLVDRALYAPEALGDDDAAFAWTCADSLRATALAGVSWWRRARFALDPRPLLPVRLPEDYRPGQLAVVVRAPRY
ncbi:transglutaminase domain-containing protein [Lentzea tibetensis]|uniref:Transglutaminase domain-containing protein n=1 Tax=Lentzea tibetensis TaxID=2591470 RepID=A0A563ETX5_9PSEU|nr:transglutaminase domain-containing protein [Lentzea tibetensis]TWP50574.1 transglutaminase domain-containing protein [Lentzea tibetensis]